MSKAKITGASRYKHSDHVSWRRVDGEVVILDLTTSAYFSLNEAGAMIWELLGEEDALDEIHDSVCGKFAVEAETARRDLEALVERLLIKKLLSPR
ncbi:MAG: PqqD family protein [Elusimicrobiota bacterium]